MTPDQKPLDILVNAVPMTGLLTGINRYLRNLYQALEALGGLKIHYLTRNGLLGRIPAAADSGSWHRRSDLLRRLPDPVILAGRSLNWWRYEYRVRRVLDSGAFALYHETAFTPAAIGRRRPQIFTLHDLSLRHWRKAHPRERVWFADIFMQRRLREADIIITPSEFIRQELHQTMAIPLSSIRVTYEAPASCFRQIDAELCRRRLQRLQLPAAFALFVGSLEPRKNIDTLISALPLTYGDIPLVLTGSSGWGAKKWQTEIKRKGLEKRVFTTGHVSDDELVALYNQATVMIYPSLYEGFGLPVIEAMACGTPVITTKRASLPEVAGSAAILLENPQEPAEMAAAIDSVIADTTRQKKMRAAGLKQAGGFSWEKTAQATRAVFFEVKS